MAHALLAPSSSERWISCPPSAMRVHPTTHRIMFRGISYNIDSIQPNFQSLDYMKIMAGTRKAGGDDDFY